MCPRRLYYPLASRTDDDDGRVYYERTERSLFAARRVRNTYIVCTVIHILMILFRRVRMILCYILRTLECGKMEIVRLCARPCSVTRICSGVNWPGRIKRILYLFVYMHSIRGQ